MYQLPDSPSEIREKKRKGKNITADQYIVWQLGVVFIITAQFFTVKPKHRFCAVSRPADSKTFDNGLG